MKNSMNLVARALTTLVATLALTTGAGCLAEDDDSQIDIGAPIDVAVDLDLPTDESEIAAEDLEAYVKARPAGDDDIVLGRPGDQPADALDDVQVDVDGAFAGGPIDPTQIGDGELSDADSAAVDPPLNPVRGFGRPARPDAVAPHTVNRPLRDQLGGAIGGGTF